MERDCNPLPLLVGMKNGLAAAKTMWWSLKMLHRITRRSVSFTPRYTLRGPESRDSSKSLYTHVHSSAIPGNLSARQCIDTQGVVHACNGRVFSRKKQHWHMLHGWTPKRDAEWKKPGTKNIQSMVPFVWGMPSRWIQRQKANRWRLHGPGVVFRSGENTLKRYRNAGDTTMWMCQAVCLKMVHLREWEFPLNF